MGLANSDRESGDPATKSRWLRGRVPMVSTLRGASVTVKAFVRTEQRRVLQEDESARTYHTSLHADDVNAQMERLTTGGTAFRSFCVFLHAPESATSLFQPSTGMPGPTTRASSSSWRSEGIYSCDAWAGGMVDEQETPDGPRLVGSGSPESLEAWKQYKRDKAVRFVERGYSVQWSPDPSNFIEVYTPRRDDTEQPEIRAGVLFFTERSKYGINGGRVSKLLIRVREIAKDYQGRPVFSWNVLYNYDRGPDVNRLSESPMAQSLFEAVLAELN